ncbi:MAG: spore germination protein GerW family protein [Myxococcales bacterium]|jgi:uncharacterized spore protein YtfJ
MSTQIADVVRQLLDGMHTISKSETIIGEPLVAKDATIIPVHRIRVGFAAGTGRGNAQAQAREGQGGYRGVGGTVQIDPVAVIAVGRDGIPRVLAVDGEAEGGIQRLWDQLPELVLKTAKGLSERLSPPVPARDEKELPPIR